MKKNDSNGKRIGQCIVGGSFLLLGMIQPLLAASVDLAEHESGPGVIAGAEEVIFPANADRRIFENDLQRFAGTYAIYSWLPEQDRVDVYRASKDGASMKDIRKLVISKRRMHY